MKPNFENNKYSEDFIREYVKNNKVTYDIWSSISGYQKLSENLIREYKDKVYWRYISVAQTLSEKFIREFKDFVEWSFICEFQEISIVFIDEMIQEGLIISKYYPMLKRNSKINQEELVAYFSLG